MTFLLAMFVKWSCAGNGPEYRNKRGQRALCFMQVDIGEKSEKYAFIFIGHRTAIPYIKYAHKAPETARVATIV